MNGTTARFVRLSVAVTVLLTLGWVLTGKAAKPARHRVSLPTDWSHRHVIFSSPANAGEISRVSQDPRYWQQIYRREFSAAQVDLAPALFKKAFHRDWAVNLGTGATLGPGNYPAKFGFDVTKADCANDYVAFGTGLQSSVTQASIVGFTNLYSGCGGSPTVNWAYNTAGQILTSAIMSLDGKQLAFVQTNPGQLGTLVLLKWAAGTGSIGTPATPTVVLPAAYLLCVAPCMTTVTLRDGSNVTTDDRTSSVFYDYGRDIIWVGGELGWVHKITGVFTGTPAEVHGGGFPVQVANSPWTSSPVYDQVSNNVFVGDALGVLYAINATTGAVTASAKLDFGAGLVDAPIIDQAKGLLYVFASSDNSGACTGGLNCAAVYQLSTTFAVGATGTEVTVGDSVAFPPTNPSPLYIGGFDSTYFSSPTRTGNLYVCGNTGFNPILYQIPLSNGAFSSSGQVTALITLASASPTPIGCSGVTDVPNPNTANGPSERIFVSVQSNGRYSVCAPNSGCLINVVNAQWKASTGYVVGQQVLSPRFHVETVITAGTSDATAPLWTNSAALTLTDGTVQWIDQGLLSTMPPVPSWLPTHPYDSTTFRVIDSNGNLQVSTTTGTSGGSAPAWNTTPGGITPDGTVTWTNVGQVGTVAIRSAGGTSGIIADNVVSQSTQAGASQVYFSTLADQLCSTSGTTGGCAVQASQLALQ